MLSLEDLLKTKAQVLPPLGAPESPGASLLQKLQQQAADPQVQAPPPVQAPAIAAAPPPVVEQAVPSMDLEEETEALYAEAASSVPPQKDPEHSKTGSFGGLSNEFLKAMQDALEGLGYNLSDAGLMQQLAGELVFFWWA